MPAPGGSSSEQVWIGLRSGPPDATRSGWGPGWVVPKQWGPISRGSLYSEVPCRGGSPCTVRSHVTGARGTCTASSHASITSNGHTEHRQLPPSSFREQNDWLMNIHDWKHYFLATLWAGGIMTCRILCTPYFMLLVTRCTFLFSHFLHWPCQAGQHDTFPSQ